MDKMLQRSLERMIDNLEPKRLADLAIGLWVAVDNIANMQMAIEARGYSAGYEDDMADASSFEALRDSARNTLQWARELTAESNEADTGSREA